MLRNELYIPWFKDKQWGFEIIDGEFTGVVIEITNAVFTDQDEKGNNLAVDYNVIHKPELLKDDDVKGELFSALFQTIVVDIIKEAVDNYEHEVDRNNDSEKPDSQ